MTKKNRRNQFRKEQRGSRNRETILWLRRRERGSRNCLNSIRKILAKKVHSIRNFLKWKRELRAKLRRKCKSLLMRLLIIRSRTNNCLLQI